MMAKKLTLNEWHKLLVTNSWDIARWAGSRFFITFHPTERTKAGRSSRWQVYDTRRKNDPDGYWQDLGYKTFGLFTNSKQQALDNAQLWAEEYYDIPAGTQWERDPFGSWHLAGTMAKAAAQAEQVLKARAAAPLGGE